MTIDDLNRMIGKTVEKIEYEEGERTAYIITSDGYGFEVPVEV